MQRVQMPGPISELSQITAGQSLLGVFWGVWFAQLSAGVLGAESATGASTALARSAYVVAAVASVITLTVFLWLMQRSLRNLIDVGLQESWTPAQVRGTTISVLLMIGVSYACVTAVVAGVPLGSYALFEGVSLHEAVLSAVVIPMWFAFMIGAALVALAKGEAGKQA